MGYRFDRAVLVAVGASVVILCMEVWVSPSAADFPLEAGSNRLDEIQKTTYLDTLRVIEMVFMGIFAVEAILKITGLGFRAYIENRFNQIDFLLVLMNLTMLVAVDGFSFNANALRVIRASRAMRALRGSKNGKAGILRMIETLAQSLPAILGVFLFMVLFIFIYALIGVQSFGSYDIPGREGYLNRHANFKTVGRAMLTLFRAVTGESWNGIMHDCMEHTWSWSFIYFNSWLLIGVYNSLFAL